MGHRNSAPGAGASNAVEVWQCIGCGRIEAPQPCIGVCQDRKVTLVGKADHDRVLEEMARLHDRIDALRSLLTQFTRATPHESGLRASWEQLQARAQQALDDDARTGSGPGQAPMRRSKG
jgi:hypothetical protein